jgi:hypothetical protein
VALGLILSGILSGTLDQMGPVGATEPTTAPIGRAATTCPAGFVGRGVVGSNIVRRRKHCGDHSDDALADRHREPGPSLKYEARFGRYLPAREWGLCGGSSVAGLGAELSGRVPITKGGI